MLRFLDKLGMKELRASVLAAVVDGPTRGRSLRVGVNADGSKEVGDEVDGGGGAEAEVGSPYWVVARDCGRRYPKTGPSVLSARGRPARQLLTLQPSWRQATRRV